MCGMCGICAHLYDLPEAVIDVRGEGLSSLVAQVGDVDALSDDLHHRWLKMETHFGVFLGERSNLRARGGAQGSYPTQLGPYVI